MKFDTILKKIYKYVFDIFLNTVIRNTCPRVHGHLGAFDNVFALFSLFITLPPPFFKVQCME